MKLSKIEKEKVVVFIIALILLLIATPFDLGISVSLYDKTTIFGRIFENHLLLLVFVPTIFSSIALFKKEKNFLFIIAAILISFYAGYENISPYVHDIVYKFVGAIVLACAFFSFIYGYICVTQVVKTKSTSRYLKAFIMFLSIVAVIHLIKVLDGRIRFRDFSEYIRYSEYTPWYDFKFLGKGNSFPSGHTSTFYVLLPFITIYTKNKDIYRYIAYVGVFMMAIARIRIGAHFLSDTMMAILISIVVEFIINRVWEKYEQCKKTSI